MQRKTHTSIGSKPLHHSSKNQSSWFSGKVTAGFHAFSQGFKSIYNEAQLAYQEGLFKNTAAAVIISSLSSYLLNANMRPLNVLSLSTSSHLFSNITASFLNRNYPNTEFLGPVAGTTMAAILDMSLEYLIIGTPISTTIIAQAKVLGPLMLISTAEQVNQVYQKGGFGTVFGSWRQNPNQVSNTSNLIPLAQTRIRK